MTRGVSPAFNQGAAKGRVGTEDKYTHRYRVT